jgi:hypothetical protein
MALTSPSLYVTRRRSSGPSHRRGLCCPVSSSGTTAAPDSHPTRISTSGLITGYRSRRSDHTHPGSSRGGEGLPGSRCHPLNVPRPIRREVHRGCKSRLFTPSMAFAVRDAARLLLSPALTGGRPNDAAGFASRYGPLSCSPQRGSRRWASTRPVCRPSRQPATGPPDSYPDGTHTRRRQRAYVGSATQ